MLSWSTEVVAKLRTEAEKSSDARPKYTYACLLCLDCGPLRFSGWPFLAFSLSTRQLITQSRVRPPLFRLPDDILADIASELDLHKDLINFALASHACANIVISRHTQYRIIRVRSAGVQLWAHLAGGADIPRNICEAHMCERHNYTAPDRMPTTLINPQLDLSQSPEADRVGNIGEALSHMSELRVFSWCWNYDGPTAA